VQVQCSVVRFMSYIHRTSFKKNVHILVLLLPNKKITETGDHPGKEIWYRIATDGVCDAMRHDAMQRDAVRCDAISHQ
jgi:hypothetical protein